MSGRTVTVDERRARLGLRHGFVDRPGWIEQLTDDLVVLHATDPASIYLSAAARMPDATVDDVDDALFERRTMLRTLAMRRTLFVVTTDLMAAVERSSSTTVATNERKRLERYLADSGIPSPSRWLSEVAAEVMDALGSDGMAARALTAAVPRLGTRIVMGAGTKNALEAGATSRVLGLMAVEGLLVRGRPSGDWTGRQYRWHRRDRWWPDGPPSAGPATGPRADTPELDESAASVELLACWLGRFGPATAADMKWWTGWTLTKVRRTLAAIETVEVGIEGRPGSERGFLLAADEEPVCEVQPWAAMLPSLDPTAMGWKERDWYLGDHRAPLFDRSGNIGPTVWVDGRIVGGWSQRPDGELVVAMLEPVDPYRRQLIDREIERLSRFVGNTVVKPSFPTPLQKRLSA